MKKSKKIILIITIILLIILAIFASIKIYQYNIYKKIGETFFNKYNSSNFYFEGNSESETYPNTKIWCKNNKVKRQYFDKSGNVTQTIYEDLENKTTYFVSEEDKTYLKENQNFMGKALPNLPTLLSYAPSLSKLSLLDTIKISFTIKSITYETLNDINTIKIVESFTDANKTTTETTWYDTTTLYPIKTEGDRNANYIFSDCTLSDEDITFTDFNNYTEIIKEPYEDEYQVSNEINNFLEAGN